MLQWQMEAPSDQGVYPVAVEIFGLTRALGAAVKWLAVSAGSPAKSEVSWNQKAN